MKPAYGSGQAVSGFEDQVKVEAVRVLPFVIPGAVLWVERGAARVGYVHWATSGTGYLGCVRV
ncbi:MAG TPA: hypothetical protein VII22_03010 [Streptosporangiaceae bacterium]